MASQDQLFFTPDLHCKFGDLVGEEAIKELRDNQTARRIQVVSMVIRSVLLSIRGFSSLGQ